MTICWLALSPLILLCSWVSQVSAQMQCGQCEGNEYKLVCPSSYSPQYFTLRLNEEADPDADPGSLIHLKCQYGSTSLNLSLISDCSFPSVKYVHFQWCPLPESSFRDTLLEIGVYPQNVTRLSFANVGEREGQELKEGHFKDLDNLLFLELKGNAFRTIPKDVLKDTPSLKYLRFVSNNIDSLPESLFSFTPNITRLDLEMNSLNSLPDGIFSNLKELRNISLWKNNLREFKPALVHGLHKLWSLQLSYNKIEQIDPNLFANLTNLRNIFLDSNRLLSIAERIFHNCPSLENINLNNNQIESIPEHIFQGSKTLKRIDFSNNQVSVIPPKLFHGLRELNNLKFKRNAVKSLPFGVFSDLAAVEVLDLQSNLLQSLPASCFDHQVKLDLLILKNNSVSELPDGIFRNCTSLKELYLGHNNLSSIDILDFPSPSVLTTLDLGDNIITFPKTKDAISHDMTLVTVEEQFALSEQVSLRKLHLKNNRIKAVPEAFSSNFVNLTELDFNGNEIEYLDLGDLSFQSNNIKVDFRNNKIKTVSLQNVLHSDSSKVVEVYLDGNSLICDCELYAFAKIVQGREVYGSRNMFQLNVENSASLYCSYSEQKNLSTLMSVMDIDADNLLCPVPNCPENCTCTSRTSDKMLIIDCAYQGLHTIPPLRVDSTPFENYSLTLNLQNNSIRNLNVLQNVEYSKLVNLTIPNNKLSSINESDISRRLEYLDVRGNNLTHISSSVLKFLNETNVVLSLGGNPWICNCDLLDLHTFLRDPTRKVTDFHNIWCYDLEELLTDVTEADLCPLIEQPVIIASITVAAVFLLMVAILGTVSYYKYKQDIKLWLFTHRMCLWAVAEEEKGSDKKYDAFISYSNKDEEFVNTKLVPGLESGDPKYKLCLHYRDWQPGEYIQNQIDQSVEASRRTIVVLSPNFIENEWGQLEFKTAHSKALKDRSNRIIVILLEEIPAESKLDEELKLYLSTRTYLLWNDSRFWDKLKYAMPHPQYFVRNKKKKFKNTEKLELVISNSKQSV